LQHLVAFVEHDEANGIELQRASLHMVHDPPGRADHHVHASLEAL